MLPWPSIYTSTLLAFAMTCAATDLAWRRIPNSLTLPMIPLAWCLSIASSDLDGLFVSLAGTGLGLCLGWIHFRAGLMGGGDAKMLAGVGALMGTEGLIVSCAWAVCLAGFSVAVSRMGSWSLIHIKSQISNLVFPSLITSILRSPRSASTRQTLCFGAFLALGIAITYLTTPSLLDGGG